MSDFTKRDDIIPALERLGAIIEATPPQAVCALYEQAEQIAALKAERQIGESYLRHLQAKHDELKAERDALLTENKRPTRWVREAVACWWAKTWKRKAKELRKSRRLWKMRAEHTGDRLENGWQAHDELRDELERERVRLAGCGVAAFGYVNRGEIKPGDYGWSASLGDVLDLRDRHDELRRLASRLLELRATPLTPDLDINEKLAEVNAAEAALRAHLGEGADE